MARAGRDALLVPPADPTALADALQRVLTDDDLRRLHCVASGEQPGRVILDGAPGRALYVELLRAGPDRAATTQAPVAGAGSV